MSEKSNYGLEEYYQEDEDEEFDQYDEFQSELQDLYTFFISNPAHTNGVNYTFWIDQGGYEFPVISSNTGGFATFNSESKEVGDGLEPTEEFFELVAYSTHEAMAFTPPTYFQSDRKFLDLADNMYDGKVRDYEAWTANVIAHRLTMPGECIPELEPLAQWANHHTDFGIPFLSE